MERGDELLGAVGVVLQAGDGGHVEVQGVRKGEEWETERESTHINFILTSMHAHTHAHTHTHMHTHTHTHSDYQHIKCPLYHKVSQYLAGLRRQVPRHFTIQ